MEIMDAGDLRISVNPGDFPRHRTARQWACTCGSCYLSDVCCADEFLGSVLDAIAGRSCEHRGDDAFLCSPCSVALLRCTERIAGTGYIPLDVESTYRLWTEVLSGFAADYPVDSAALSAIEAHIHRLMDAHDDPNDAGVESSRLHYELLDLCAGVVIDSIPAGTDHVAVAHELITLFFRKTHGLRPDEWSPVAPRVDMSTPKRRWATRAESEIAERHGWSEPERYSVERLVRTAAIEAFNEAEFILHCLESGLTLRPRPAENAIGVVGYSAAKPTDHGPGTWFSGSSLAPDLSLRHLRWSWGGDELNSTAAIATWAAHVDATLLDQAVTARHQD
ncbi:hypothetical protein [Nocardia paucivorans]|uniref:hypothetical protein n=1 Tax=Nocardia paucivorans TaxID=114259 RepID=UPI0005928D9C|nr:hypothetical protein [Nocardia paucivorans]